MILLTELNGKKYYLNPDLIEKIESSPDTVISLTTGKKLVVRESAEDVVDKYIKVKNKIFKIPEGEL